MNTEAMRAAMQRAGKSTRETAAAAGLDYRAFTGKLDGAGEFLLGEITSLRAALRLSNGEVDRIFFDA